MLIRILLTILIASLFSCTFTDHSTIEERKTALPISQSAHISEITSKGVSANPSKTLRAVTINLAHGRNDGVNQWLVSAEQTRQNLDNIARFLRDEGADVVALQEADNPSRWSGGFDHVEYLAEQAGYPFFVHAEHARIWMGNYGTAVLSRWPVMEAVGLTFPSTPPTASKGFTLAQIQWSNPVAPGEQLILDVVSVHLDFSRKSVRLRQIDELAEVLEPRTNSMIIMGDFNSEWLAEEYLVQNTTDSSSLHVFEPASRSYNTYKDMRLDWIMLSGDLQFTDYAVADQQLSDHKVVSASIEWRKTP